VDHVEIAGLRVAYQRVGQGPPVVLLHGGASDSREWRHQIDGLADEFTVVAWDAPGCGRSADPPEPFSLADYADCLAGLLDALRVTRSHVVGLSFGGGLALELYRRHRGMAMSLVLASAYAGWAGSLSPAEVEQRLGQVESQAELPADDVVAQWLPSLLTESASPQVVAELSAIMSDFHPAGVRTMARAFAQADLRDASASVDVPTLLLYGDEDRRAPEAVTRHLHATIPGSRLVTIPGVGHQANMQAPDRFTDELRQFLRSGACMFAW
jgi:pimeloyl-ACP methyl ester carboxylesterase